MSNQQNLPYEGPDMTSSEGRVAHLRNWVDQLEQEIARLAVQRDALWQAIAVLDPDATVIVPAPVDVFANAEATGAGTPVMPGESPKISTEKPRVKRKDGPPAKRSNKGRPPLAEIAGVYNAARAAGRRTGPAMAEHFGVPLTSTNNWPAALRKAGLIDDKAGPAQPAKPPALSIVKERPATRAEAQGKKPASSKPSLAQVAADVIEFRTAGRPVAKELSIRYRVPESTTRNWMAAARSKGLVPELHANLKVIEDNTAVENPDAVYNAAEVAEAYRDAVRNNRRPLAAVADTFDVDKATATNWVRQARLDGALPSAADPQLSDEERRTLLDMSKPEPVS